MKHWGCGTAISTPRRDWFRWCRDGTRIGRGPRAEAAGEVPVPARVIRLYADYLHAEYGDLDSDYVFVNLWSGPIGHPMTYPQCL